VILQSLTGLVSVVAVPFVVSLALSAASAGAQLLLTYLGPKPPDDVRGKFEGNLNVNGADFGLPIARMYGGPPPGVDPT
jgi:hypothetical protein